MITLILLTAVIVVGLFFGIHFYRWNTIQEGTIVYRCDHSLKVLGTYNIVFIGDQKYLVNTMRNEPYIRFSFSDYLKDIRSHRIFIDDGIDDYN